MDFLLAALGLTILVLAGDALVRGAVNMSLRVGVPALVVSLTIVAFGTSAPELLVSVQAVLGGVPGIALGNVVGSNIANVLMVLGLPAMISGLVMRDAETRRSYWVMAGVSLLFVALAFAGPFRVWHGLVLLAALAAVLLDHFRTARAHRRAGIADEEEVEGADPELRWWKILLFLGLGLAGLPLGANILIDASVNIAERFGISDTVIGLTLVAIGTSLPELATTVMAALRGRADVALGNVIGSNVFNLLAIVGITSMVAPVPVDPVLLRFDLWIMLAAAAVLAPFAISGWRLGRIWGASFAAIYGGYLWVVVTT
ncbi:calcium/sodium antiporter [Roseitranquillus sediminis]|uniref:calcium/sodium antiporter n=1 Tax=Roseitranquillus sediminis TaxID=2809051 RepID=UPI001D0CDA88|nr:calcium/sodium antiporter [Roseitranquillus sediminis]MBM9593358.1 calcium/sodium antiporter [Roseitranquillus sediminis]